LALQVYSPNSTSVTPQALVVNGAGNVGIGKTPSYALDVSGTISASTLMVDKLVNRTVSNISVSGQLLPDTNAPTTSQTIGSASTPWKSLYANELYLA
jgi:hypothetical protein